MLKDRETVIQKDIEIERQGDSKTAWLDFITIYLDRKYGTLNEVITDNGVEKTETEMHFESTSKVSDIYTLLDS